MLATLLLTRLRAHLGRSLVVIVVVGVACGIAISALAVREAADDPWPALHTATNGGDVEITDTVTRPDLQALAALPHVEVIGVPVESGEAAMQFGSDVVRVSLLKMTDVPAIPVDRPVITAGGWFASGDEAVLETAFADTLGVSVGDSVILAGGQELTVRVVGTAATTMFPSFPERTPGAVFVSHAVFDEVEPVGPRRWSIGLRLDDATYAAQVANQISGMTLTGTDSGEVETSQEIRDESFPSRTRAFAEFVLLFAVLMLTAAVMLIVVLLGSRLVSEARQLTLLQVAGLTPGRLALMIGIEHALLAALGALAGIPVALWVAPRIAEPTAILGTVTPALTSTQIAFVAVGAIALSAAVATIGGLRAGRRSLSIVARGGTTTVHHSRAAGLALKVTPWVWLVVGLKDILTRRGRAITTVLSTTLAVAMGMALVGLGSATDIKPTTAPIAAVLPTNPASITELPAFPQGINAVIVGRITALITVMQLLLGAVAVATLVAAAAMSMRERVRELGVLHALGHTTVQLVSAAVVSQATLGALGALFGVPLGLGLYLVLVSAGAGENVGFPPAIAVASVVVIATVAAAITGVVPALLTQRIPTSVALATE